MVSDSEVLEFFREELSVLATWYFKIIPLEIDTILQEYTLDSYELFEAIEKFDVVFSVDISTMNWDNYYPWEIEWFYRKWFVKEPIKQTKKPLTVRMFAESAKAGKWLYS